MGGADERSVVLIGAGQVVERDPPPERAHEPAGLMEAAARHAAEDAGAGAALFGGTHAVVAVNVLGWRYPSAARALAERLGASGARLVDTHVGGNTPQSAVNALAERVRAGELSSAVVAGAEAIRSMRRARKAGATLPWSRDEAPAPEARELLGDDRPGSTEREKAFGLQLPPNVYPLFESALRARLGRSPEAHRAALGRLYERFAAVAAENPYAWFPVARKAEEIATPGPGNRMVAHPYTKYMNAVMEVNQGAALLVASEAEARRLGVPEERWVWLWGGDEAAEDPWFVSERPDLSRCPAQERAAQGALARAGASADEITAFDLYSCFPVAVELAAESLGIAEDDPRPLTLTGGLAYAGGPGNAYSLHGIARMLERLREERDGLGLVTALGWYLTKHAAGVYAGRPPERAAREAPAPEPGPPAPALVDDAEGAATVESYTVIHDREGAPERAVVVGRLEGGERFLADAPPERALLEALEREEAVGRRGRVGPGPEGRPRFAPD